MNTKGCYCYFSDNGRMLCNPCHDALYGTKRTNPQPPTCKIQWVNESGAPTPDSNPAIGYVQREAYSTSDPTTWSGTMTYTETEWYPICAHHAKELSTEGMEHWHFKPLESE